MIETLRVPRQILAGPGTASQIPALCAAHGSDVLLMVDRVLVDQPGVSALIEGIRTRCASLTLHTDVSPDVPLSDVCHALAIAEDADAEVTVAIGGGTVIDLAKIVGVLRRYGGRASDYYGECAVPGPTAALIAVPTTAGTGSEVSPVSVLSDPDRELKVGVSSPYLIPDVAVVDPELALTCPPSVTAHSGADALCHAIESYIAPAKKPGVDQLSTTVFRGRNAVTDDAALRAVRLISCHLSDAVADGSNLRAREGMALGALWAGVAFSHAGTGCPHALQYPLGAATKTPHGLGVGLLLPYALAAVRHSAADRLTTLAEVVGLSRGLDPVASFVEWVARLLWSVGIPRTLAEIGISASEIPSLAKRAATVTRLMRNHPGDTSEPALESVLSAALTGEIDLRR